MSELSAETIRRGLPTKSFGQTIYYVEKIGSTNVELKRLADVGASEGTLYLTEEQLAGRGRFNRAWQVPAGSSLLMSLLFRPTFLAPIQAQRLTMTCSLALVEAIEAETGLIIDLKWPNDLVYDGRKLAGVLTEIGFVGNDLAWAVVGAGLNVNVDFNLWSNSPSPADTPLAETATSLQMILGRPVSRLGLLQHYLSLVEKRYEALRNGFNPHHDWAGRLVTLGRQVSISDADLAATRTGLAEAVDEDGALLVRLADGRLERILAGDVSLR